MHQTFCHIFHHTLVGERVELPIEFGELTKSDEKQVNYVWLKFSHHLMQLNINKMRKKEIMSVQR